MPPPPPTMPNPPTWTPPPTDPPNRPPPPRPSLDPPPPMPNPPPPPPGGLRPTSTGGVAYKSEKTSPPCSDPTQHAKGRTGDCPGPRKGTTTRRTVTQGVSLREILVAFFWSRQQMMMICLPFISRAKCLS